MAREPRPWSGRGPRCRRAGAPPQHVTVAAPRRAAPGPCVPAVQRTPRHC